MGSKAFELCKAIIRASLNLYVCKVMSLLKLT